MSKVYFLVITRDQETKEVTGYSLKQISEDAVEASIVCVKCICNGLKQDAQIHASNDLNMHLTFIELCETYGFDRLDSAIVNGTITELLMEHMSANVMGIIDGNDGAVH